MQIFTKCDYKNQQNSRKVVLILAGKGRVYSQMSFFGKTKYEYVTEISCREYKGAFQRALSYSTEIHFLLFVNTLIDKKISNSFNILIY